MIKMSKQGTVLRERTAAALRLAGDNLSEAMEAYFAAVKEAWAPLQEAMADYNDLVNDIREDGLGTLVQGWRDEWDEKSEKWQQSPKGEAADAFIRQYEEALRNLETVEIEPPEEIDIPDFSACPGMLEEECFDEPDSVEED